VAPQGRSTTREGPWLSWPETGQGDPL